MRLTKPRAALTPRISHTARHRALALLLLALTLSLPARPAPAEYWDDVAKRPVVCCDDRAGCQILQMVMMGSFVGFDPDDSLSVRVLSAALPRLCAITQEDIAHFIDEFDVPEEVIRRFHYIALGHGLWADIIASPTLDDARATDARRVLLVFLNPASEKNGLEQMALIRLGITDELIETLAQAAALPVGFVEYLIYDDDWYQTIVLGN